MSNKIHCAHILVKTEKEANKILERLKKGDKFSKIAKELSLCPSKKRGGDLGTFGRGQMVKEFEKAAFALQKGQISPIVKTKFGYHIIRRLE
jgi:peptidyl-prolyl cis-trans isomerase C